MTNDEVKQIILNPNPTLDQVMIVVNEFLLRKTGRQLEGPIHLNFHDPFEMNKINVAYQKAMDYFLNEAGITITKIIDIKTNTIIKQF